MLIIHAEEDRIDGFVEWVEGGGVFYTIIKDLGGWGIYTKSRFFIVWKYKHRWAVSLICSCFSLRAAGMRRQTCPLCIRCK